MQRLNGDLTDDPGFPVIPISYAAFVVRLQPDGKILVGGDFDSIAGVTRENLARLNPDGSLDTSFTASGARFPRDLVSDLLLQPDGKIIVAGAYEGVGRLNPNGSLDGTFISQDDWGFRLSPFSHLLAQQPDGKILAGLARLHPDGRLDTNYNLGWGPPRPENVHALALQADDHILYGGAFQIWHRFPQHDLARVLSDSDLAAGQIQFAYPGENLAGILYKTNSTSEGNGTAILDLIRTDGESDRVTVDWAITGGSAEAGSDFILTNGTAVFEDHQLSTNVQVHLLSDARVEGDETIEFSLSNPSGRAALGRNTVSAVVIEHNDYPGAISRDVFGFNFNVQRWVEDHDEQLLKFTLLSNRTVLLTGAFTNLDGQPRNGVARLTAGGWLDETFTGSTGISTGQVKTIIMEPDDKLLIGGTFVATNEATTYFGLARLDATGNLDPTYPSNLRTGAVVSAVANQAGGGVLVGGAFYSADGSVSHLARFNPDGTVDPAFQVRIAGSVSPYLTVPPAVDCIAIQPDGRILIGGNFSSVNGVPRLGIARLFGNGSIDPDFAAEANGRVLQMILLDDDRLYVRGSFTAMNRRWRSQVDRLNPDGSSDLSFRPPVNFGSGNLLAMAVQGDGKLLLGGVFYPANFYGPGLFRLNPDGTRDVTFETSLLAVGDMSVDGGELLVFHTETFYPASRLSRVSLQATNGGPLLLFNPAVAAVRENYANALLTVERMGSLAPCSVDYSTSDGTGIAGRDYVPARGTISFAAGERRKTIAVPLLEDIWGEDTETVNVTLSHPSPGAELGAPSEAVLKIVNDDAGSVDEQFLPPVLSAHELLVQPDGKVLVNGNYLLGDRWAGPIRLNSDGSLDTHFTSNSIQIAFRGQSCYATGLALDRQTNVIAAQCMRETPLVRFHPDGTPDTTFRPALTGEVSAVTVQADGKILVSGQFWPNANVLRLGSNGSFDPDFRVVTEDAPQALTYPQTILLLRNGQLLVSGYYDTDSPPGPGLVRLNMDGSLDRTFRAEIGYTRTMLEAPDGKILVGGFRLLARLNRDGSRDSSFNGDHELGGLFPKFNGPFVDAMALQPDGKIIIAGAFTRVGDVSLWHLARLNPNGSLDRTFLPVTDPVDDGSVDPMFVPRSPQAYSTSAPRYVETLALLPDGAMLIGGVMFARIRGDWAPRLSANLSRGAGQEFLTLSYPRVKAAVGITNVIEVSSDLQTWRPAPVAMQEVSAHENGNDTETVLVRANTPVSANTNLFIRLSVQSTGTFDTTRP